MPNDTDRVMREIASLLVADPPPPPDWPLGGAIVAADVRGRRWVLPAVTAAAVIAFVVAGLWLIGGRVDDSPEPATDPGTVPSSLGLPVRPDRYPVVGDPGPADSSVAGQYSQRSSPGGPQVIALLARHVDNMLVDGVTVTAGTVDVENMPGPREPITVWGRPATLYVENGTPVLSTVVVPLEGGVSLSFVGRDPLALIEQVEPDTVRIDVDTAAAPGVPFSLRFGPLLAGFEVVAGPQAIAAETISASLRVGNDGEPGSAFVEVSVTDHVFGAGSAADLVGVDINGTPGWMRPDAGYWASWSVNDHTFVMVGGTNSAEETLDIARRLKFVDEPTWQARYSVDEPRFTELTPTCPTTVTADAQALRLAPDTIPDGMYLLGCRFDVLPAGDNVVDRIYATATSTPETGAAFVLTTIDARYGSPHIADDAEVVTVQGVDAWLTAGTTASSLTVSIGPIDGMWQRLTGYHVTRDELLTAANSVQSAPDGYGAILDPTALPADVTEIAAGVRDEGIWLTGRDAQQRATGRANWIDGGQRAFTYRTKLDTGADLVANRIGFDDVTDIVINGQSGYHATLGDFHTIVWSDGDMTVTLGANGLTADELLTVADSMHEASQQEWENLVATMPTSSNNTAPATTGAG